MENVKSGGSTVLNKILIPVITTVLGATAIYFLGFNKKTTSGRTDMEQLLLSKEATVKAWRSFVTAQNIGFKNVKSLADQFGEKTAEAYKQGLEKLVPVWREYESEYLRESKKFILDIEHILKEEDIDRDFVSMLNRTLDNGKDQEKKIANFFDKMVSLVRSDRDQNEKVEKLQSELTKFMADGKKDEERMVTESEGIAKILVEKYNQAFDLNELLVYVEYKKEKEKENTIASTGTNTNNKEPAILAPPDPNKGIESTEKIQDDNKAASGSNSGNETEPTESLLTGQWTTTGGTLELSRNGDMFWVFEGKGYTSGDWKLTDGKLRINATNPDTDKTSHLIGFLSNVTRNSFTLTFMTSPKEVYNFTRKN
jgi:hypothetical protein